MPTQPQEPSIEQMNEIIAKFLELDADVNTWRRPYGSVVYLIDGYWFPTNKLKYHSSWDWLMPVGKKIFDLMQADIKERPPHTLSNGDWWECEISFAIREYDIKMAHEKVVGFIQWYNEQKKQP